MHIGLSTRLHMCQLNIWVLFAHSSDNFLPQLTNFQNIALLHTAQLAFALLGRLECYFGYSLNLQVRTANITSAESAAFEQESVIWCECTTSGSEYIIVLKPTLSPSSLVLNPCSSNQHASFMLQ